MLTENFHFLVCILLLTHSEDKTTTRSLRLSVKYVPKTNLNYRVLVWAVDTNDFHQALSEH